MSRIESEKDILKIIICDEDNNLTNNTTNIIQKNVIKNCFICDNRKSNLPNFFPYTSFFHQSNLYYYKVSKSHMNMSNFMSNLLVFKDHIKTSTSESTSLLIPTIIFFFFIKTKFMHVLYFSYLTTCLFTRMFHLHELYIFNCM